MADKAWKARERRMAKDFGTVRNPLSGGNSGVTRSDSRHPTLYLECKSGVKHKIWTLLDDTIPKAKLENKTPVLITFRNSSPGYLISVHSKDFEKVAVEYLKEKGYRVLGDEDKKKKPERKSIWRV